MCARPLVSVLVVLAVPFLLNPPEGNACGPFLPGAQFGFVHNPGPGFLRGELGLVKPQYYVRHLVIAYRYFSGAPLTRAEIRALSQTARTCGVAAGLGAGRPSGCRAVAGTAKRRCRLTAGDQHRR